MVTNDATLVRLKHKIMEETAKLSVLTEFPSLRILYRSSALHVRNVLCPLIL